MGAAGALYSSAFTLLYTSSIYVHPAARVSAGRTRDDKGVMRARMALISLATALCLALLFFGTGELLPRDSHAAREAAGLVWPREGAWRGVVVPTLLTSSLFTGSLFVFALAGELPGQARTPFGYVLRRLTSLAGLRDYIIGPATEELVFRSCIIAVSASQPGASRKSLVLLSPLYFGLAHVHHAYGTYLNGGKTSHALKVGLLNAAFQFAYTTLFGWYASFLFISTGSIVAPLVSHTLCNALGIPPIQWALSVFSDRKASIWAAYIAGIAAFTYGMFAMAAQMRVYDVAAYAR